MCGGGAPVSMAQAPFALARVPQTLARPIRTLARHHHTLARGASMEGVLGEGVVGESTVLQSLEELGVFGGSVSGVANAEGEGVGEEGDDVGSI